MWPDFFQVLRRESSEEHRPTTILGVLRLRARNPLLSGRSARRFAQDDGLAWSLKNLLVGCRGGEKERRSLGFAANDTGASGPRFSTAPTALSSYSELSPSPSGLGSRLDGRPSPGFPVELVGFGKLHAPFFMERRTRGSLQCSVAGNPGPGLASMAILQCHFFLSLP
jgi:hypothetical protein